MTATVAPEVSGCLLPSLPSDAVLDQSSGISFVCDLNDNIPAPWPSLSHLPVSSCNKTMKIPALPAAASGQISLNSLSIGSHLRLLALTALGSLFYT
uniref:Uncharacterized GPI-anchored protein n=1 Tax=Solanum tuberosum TaxID=4113 RepID=M1BD12_SOLTU